MPKLFTLPAILAAVLALPVAWIVPPVLFSVLTEPPDTTFKLVPDTPLVSTIPWFVKVVTLPATETPVPRLPADDIVPVDALVSVPTLPVAAMLTPVPDTPSACIWPWFSRIGSAPATFIATADVPLATSTPVAVLVKLDTSAPTPMFTALPPSPAAPIVPALLTPSTDVTMDKPIPFGPLAPIEPPALLVIVPAEPPAPDVPTAIPAAAPVTVPLLVTLTIVPPAICTAVPDAPLD